MGGAVFWTFVLRSNFKNKVFIYKPVRFVKVNNFYASKFSKSKALVTFASQNRKLQIKAYLNE